jgi:hypothetical protein
MAATKHKCAGAAKHRARQNRYVAKDPAAQRRRVRKHYGAHAAELKAKARKQRKSAGKSKSGGKMGRPREC